ncbi:hypothetical protein HQ49_09430 [Porphyromonas gulae]|nr:hypothetical protein HQ49_09430 [Porphyromonas gulae]
MLLIEYFLRTKINEKGVSRHNFPNGGTGNRESRSYASGKRFLQAPYLSTITQHILFHILRFHHFFFHFVFLLFFIAPHAILAIALWKNPFSKELREEEKRGREKFERKALIKDQHHITCAGLILLKVNNPKH